MIEQNFGRSPAFSLGVEEEVMILDAETFALVPGVRALLAGAEGRQLPGLFKTELHASIIELNTGICLSVDDSRAALATLRRAADEIARADGMRIAAAGTHPFSRAEEQEVVGEERYKTFLAYGGVSVRRQAVNGLHVHVGVESAEACFHALEGMLPWLPVVLALSANSPYADGVQTGLASNRAEVLAQLPRAGAPPAFDSYAGWEAFVDRFVAAGVAEDYTRFWWDARPHPKFGTVEVRMPDQPTALERTVAFTALLQALAATALERPLPSDRAGRRGDYAQNRWAALRFGAGAELIHPEERRAVNVAELAAELLELVRPAAGRLGGAPFLDALDGTASEADLQIAVGTRDGLRAAAADVAERTVVSN
ncbi:MAG: carboxylate-amine ligase [Gaiellaceae bacterium]